MFSAEARRDAGYQLDLVQNGKDPDDWKPLPVVGKETQVTKRLKMVKGSDNVFRDLGFPEPEAQNLLLRSRLMMKVRDFVERSGLTQHEAARALGITQPRLNLLLKGKINKFSLDALVNMLANAGMKVNLTVKKAA